MLIAGPRGPMPGGPPMGGPQGGMPPMDHRGKLPFSVAFLPSYMKATCASTHTKHSLQLITKA